MVFILFAHACLKVKTLVQKRLLLESPTWELDRAMYMSCVTHETADILSQSVDFNLQDFIFAQASSLA